MPPLRRRRYNDDVGGRDRDSEPTRRNVIVSNETVGIRAGELEQRRNLRGAKRVARGNEWRAIDTIFFRRTRSPIRVRTDDYRGDREVLAL